MSRSDTAKCPNCGGMVEIDFFNEIGDEVLCNSCDSELEIVRKNPPKFKILKRQDIYDEYGDDSDYDDEGFE